MDLVNDRRCDCEKGFDGDDCSNSKYYYSLLPAPYSLLPLLSPAPLPPCPLNGAICVDLVNDRRCDCVKAFDGDDSKYHCS